MSENENAGLIILFSMLRVTGKDTKRFLNGMLTNDISRALENAPTCGRTFFLTSKAKIVSEIVFYCPTPDECWLLTEKNSGETLRTALDHYLIADQVVLAPLEDRSLLRLVTSEFSKIELLAPRHPQGLEKIFKATPLVDRPNGQTNIVLPRQLLSPTHVDVLVVDPDSIPPFKELRQTDLWEYYFQTGQPQWGVDIKSEDFYLEFPLQDSVSFDKGCYIGQEVVARGTFRGKVNKGFTKIESTSEVEVGEATGEEDGVLGRITSAQGTRGLGIFKFSALEKTELKLQILVNAKTFRGER